MSGGLRLPEFMLVIGLLCIAVAAVAGGLAYVATAIGKGWLRAFVRRSGKHGLG